MLTFTWAGLCEGLRHPCWSLCPTEVIAEGDAQCIHKQADAEVDEAWEEALGEKPQAPLLFDENLLGKKDQH